tara:strand:- start:226 stop:384 length:159 start_codon:yes stop_codon:yes gene_type:complete
MVSTARLALCALLLVVSHVMAIVGAANIMYRASYLQAQRDLPAQQQCNDLIR